jgi:hypothetical protein
MKGPDCEIIRDLLPDFGAGCLLSEEGAMVETHLGSCPDCRKDLEVIVALRGARPDVPPDLEARIQARVRNEMAREGVLGPGKASQGTAGVLPLFGRPRWAPAWLLSAAAVVILALGVGVVWDQRTSDPMLDPVLVASQEPLPEAWLWDDGMVAGAPVFDGLSDEDLEALLKEFEG